MNYPNESLKISWQRRIAGWSVHAFTASGALMGLMALLAIYNHQLIQAFWFMGAAVMIDAVDGVLARLVKIRAVVPQINGELLDNIVDFFNYTMVPAFFILVSSIVPDYWCLLCVVAITLASAYQFTQVDAKTSDHFFKGFPSYWNIVVFYLFFWQMSGWTNFVVLMILAGLSFVPIKYIYPSRLDHLSDSKALRLGVLLSTVIWGLATWGLMVGYPESNSFLNTISMSYMILYMSISMYRTWVPLHQARRLSGEEHSLA